jgi:hypothetical protein
MIVGVALRVHVAHRAVDAAGGDFEHRDPH